MKSSKKAMIYRITYKPTKEYIGSVVESNKKKVRMFIKNNYGIPYWFIRKYFKIKKAVDNNEQAN